MKFFSALCTSVALLVQFSGATCAQQLVELQPGNFIDRSLLEFVVATSGFDLEVKNSIRIHKVLYTMDNLSGRQDTVSGVLVVPVTTSTTPATFPRLIIQHGTTRDKYAVPSTAVPATDLTHLAAAQGYVVLAPDYLNMGSDEEGFHPYVHARTEAASALRLMQSLESRAEFNRVANDSLFITGYSQGGHASMALQKLLTVDYPSIPLTAASHMSGPYSISQVMYDVVFQEEPYNFAAYIPYTLISYQEAYGNLYQRLEDVFRPGYVENIARWAAGFSTGEVDLYDLNQQLLDTLVKREGSPILRYMLTDSFVQAVTANPAHPLRVAMRDNDTYTFTATVPTRLIYCSADDQVPYQNALLARDSLLARGSSDVVAIDVDPDADHGACVPAAIGATLSFFDSLRQQTVSVRQTLDKDEWTAELTTGRLRITKQFDGPARVEVYRTTGQLLTSAEVNQYTSSLYLNEGQDAILFVRLSDSRGRWSARAVHLR